MAIFHPLNPPSLLRKKERDAEREAWVLFSALDDHWNVYYSVRDPVARGYVQEVDYVLLRYGRIFFVEVKGGIVHVDNPVQPGVRWRQHTRSGAPVALVDPTQLWRAKRSIRAMLYRHLGIPLRRAGFTEYEIYLLPHTARTQVPFQGELNSARQFVFLRDDLDRLPSMLDALAKQWDSETRKVGWHWIRKTQSALAEACFPAESVPVRAVTAARVSYPSGPPTAVVEPVTHQTGKQPPRRFDQVWWKLALGLGLVAALLWYASSSSRRPSPMSQRIGQEQASPVSSANAVTRPAQGTAPAGAPKELTKPPTSATRPEAAKARAGLSPPAIRLPSFIPASAAPAVEETLLKATELNRSFPWQSGSAHGFATLQAVESAECRRYRITRNDTDPIGLEFIRRCL